MQGRDEIGRAYGWSRCRPADEAVLRRQLGRAPRPALAVAVRCRYGSPQVIVNDPLPQDESGYKHPFPTLFWLTCPYLVRAVGELESEGYIGRMRERLAGEAEFAAGMAAAHARHAALRLALADPAAARSLRESRPAQYRVLAESGIGGASSPGGVKCLHVHLADYLARCGPRAREGDANPIGEATVELLFKRGVDLLGSSACSGCSAAGCLAAVRRGAPVAAVDIGSNSIRLWLGAWAEREAPPAGWRASARLRATTRLGAGMQDGTGTGEGPALSDEAMARSLAALAEFAQACRAAGAVPVAAATAAVRRARNGGAFLRRVHSETGISAPVVSGEEEARLAFVGAVRGVVAGDADQPCAVVDVGGASTEVALGFAGGDVVARASLPFGAVRSTEEFFREGPPAAAVAALRRAVGEALAAEPALAVALRERLPAQVIAVGGTATSLAAMRLRLERYEPEIVHGTQVDLAELEELLAHLLVLSLEERRRVPGLEPERADVIVAGVAVLQAVLAALGARRVTVSEADILEGLLWQTYPEGVPAPTSPA